MKKPETVLGFINANIWCSRENIIKNGFVEIQNGSIKDVGYMGEHVQKSTCVDLAGSWIIPGLINCNTHITLPDTGERYHEISNFSDGYIGAIASGNVYSTLKGGVTVIRDIGGINYIDVTIRDLLQENKITGPAMFAAGKIITIPGGHGSQFAITVTGKHEITVAVRRLFEARADFIKLIVSGGVLTPSSNPSASHMTYEEVLAAVHEAHRLGLKVAAHCQNSESALISAQAGVDTIEHGIDLTPEIIDIMLEKNIGLVPTLSPVEAIVNSDSKAISNELLNKCQFIRDAHINSFKMAYKAGVKILMGSDSGTPMNKHSEGRKEIVYMINNGVSVVDALHFSTAQPAEFLGLYGKGKLEVGYDADFCIVNGDVLDNYKVIADENFISKVFVSGKCLYSNPISKP